MREAKKIVTAMIIALWLIPMGIRSLEAGGVPVLKNGGFEEPNARDIARPADWAEGRLSEDHPHGGKYCLFLENTKGGWFSAVQVIENLPPDRYYTLTFFYRSDGGGDALPLSVSAYSRTGIPESSCYLPKTTAWHPGRVDFYSGKGGTCNINFTAHGSGKSVVKVWIDDVIVEEMSEAKLPSPLLLDPGFEAGEIGGMAPDWQRISLDDKRNEGRYARFGSDATQSWSGSRSLRIDFPENGFFEIRSERRILRPEVPYGFSVWAKASSEGTKLRLGVGGVYAAGRDFVIGKEWQKVGLTFTVHRDRFAASENKHVTANISSGLQKAGVTLWLDDACWEAVKPENKAENLLPNGSFELAANSSFPDWWGCNSGINLVPFYEIQGRDNTTAVHGQYSHRIKARSIELRGAKSFRGSDIEIRFPVPGVVTPTDYVLSAYLKSDGGNMSVRLSLDTYFIRGQYTLVAKLTPEWKRYSLRIPLDEKSINKEGNYVGDAEIRVNITPLTEGTYWTDAVQFEQGSQATPYQESTRYAHLWGSVQGLPSHEGTPPVVKAVWVKTEPAIDGRLDDPIWEKAAHVKDFVLNREAAPAIQKTEAWVAFTPAHLCVAFKCYDDQMDKIKADVKERNGPVYGDDCVELFIDTTHNHESFFQFVLNTINTQACYRKGDTRWDASWQSGIAKGDGFWTAEMSIPLAALEMDKSLPTTWGINFCRENHKVKEYSTWSFVNGGFLAPTRFGHLERVPIQRFSDFFWRLMDSQLKLCDPMAGRYNLEFQIQNASGRTQDAMVQTTLSERESEKRVNQPRQYEAPRFAGPAPEGEPKKPFYQQQENVVRFERDSIGVVTTADFELGRSPKSDYRLSVRILGKRDGTLLRERQTIVAIPDLFDGYFERSFYMQEAEAVLVAHVFGCGDNFLKQLSLKLSVEVPGKTVIEKKADFSTNAMSRLVVDISNLPEGAYPAKVELCDITGATLAVKQDRLIKLPFRSSAVPVDRSTRTLLVDGQAFVPYFFGLSRADCMHPMIPEIAAAGFNGIICSFAGYGGYESKDEEIQMFLDDCQRYGLKIIYWLRPPPSFEKKGGDMDASMDSMLRYMELIVPKFREHPALVAWKFADEWWDEKLTGKLYRGCRELDPYHPVYLNTCLAQFSCFDGWLAAPDLFTDIFSGDIYPFGRYINPSSNIEDVARYADIMMRLAARHRNPVYMWCQGFGNLGAEAWFRDPTLAEQEAMIYLLKIHGLTGLYYFINRPDARECWDAMVRLGREMKTLDPILLGTEPEKQLRVFQSHIHAAMVKPQGEPRKSYLFVAHAAPEPCAFTIPLDDWGMKSDKTGQATVLFENRRVSIKDGLLKDTFSGYGRHVYEIRAK